MGVPRDAAGHAPQTDERAAAARRDREQRLAKRLQHRNVLAVWQHRAPGNIAGAEVEARDDARLARDERKALLTRRVEERMLGEANLLPIPVSAWAASGARKIRGKHTVGKICDASSSMRAGARGRV